ncbi:MAG: ROK family transcriptional regulator [Deinococcus sp.]
MLSGTNVEYAHQYNKRIVLETIRRFEAISKAELSRQTGLTTQAIGNIVEQFLDSGVVEVRGRQASKRGQPAVLLGLRPQGGYSVGLHLDRDHLSSVLLDLSGTALARFELEWSFPTPEQALPQLIAAIEELLKLASVRQDQLWGVGVSLPGPIETGSGRLMSPPNFVGWNGATPRSWLEERLLVPIYVETDATAAAIGERWFGAGRGHLNLFYVFLGMGVGGGMLSDGLPFRGASGSAAMFGHTPAGDEGRQCACGGTDCLETYISLAALLNDLGQDALSHLAGTALGEVTPLPDAQLQVWLEQAAQRLATAVISMKSLTDPEIVIIGGRMPSALLSPLIERTARLVAQREPRIVRPTHIVRAELSDDAALGAATIALFNSITPDTEVLNKLQN